MPGAALADAAECGPRGRGLWSLVLAAAGTRLLVVAAGAAGTFFPRLDYRFWSGAAEGGLRWAYEPSRILDIFGRWDTWYYLRIAAAGYQRAAAGDQNEGAFFPLFPMLVRGVAVLTRLPLYLAGLLVAWTCFALAVRAVHGLFADVAGEERATRATAALLVFPGSLFLTAVYTESLFLLLSATAVRAARWRAFGLAGLAAALAAGTRPNGVLVLLPVAIELGAALRRREPVGPGAALLWSEDPSSDLDLGLRLAGATREFWTFKGYLREGRAWVTRLLARSTTRTARASSAYCKSARGRWPRTSRSWPPRGPCAEWTRGQGDKGVNHRE